MKKNKFIVITGIKCHKCNFLSYFEFFYNDVSETQKITRI